MELSDLINADFDVSLTGFIPTEIDELLTDVLPGTGNEEEPYTTKIDTPVYEPSGSNPDISELYDDTKTQELISRIRSASLSLILRNSSCVRQNVTRCLISAELRTITLTPL